MKELLGHDPYRSIVSQVLPGLVAASTWIIALHDHSPGVRNFLDQSTPVATGSLALAAIFWGLVCEDFGSRIEVLIFWLQTKNDPTAKQIWFEYLRMAYSLEPIGIRYIRSLVTRLKFELNGTVALIIAGIGLFFTHVSFVPPAWLAVAMWSAASYIAFEAWSTVKLLRDVRQQMTRPITLVGPVLREKALDSYKPVLLS